MQIPRSSLSEHRWTEQKILESRLVRKQAILRVLSFTSELQREIISSLFERHFAFQRFGFFYILPTTAPTIVSSPNFTVPATTITSSSTDPCVVTIGDYNVSASPRHGIYFRHDAYFVGRSIIWLQRLLPSRPWRNISQPS